jgi:H+/gluconate symporter-like permease
MVFSLIGIVVAVVVFIILAFKQVNVLISTIVAAVIIMITGNLPILDTMNSVYMAGFGSFIKAYLLLFMLSGLFGKLMTDSGAARSIALALVGLVKKSGKNQQFLTIIILPIFYFMLSYAGVSGFVLVFTVIAIGRELFEQCDIPWKYYCYGSAGIYPAMILGGSAYASNIIATTGYNVAPTAAMGLSIILVLVSWAVLALLIYLDINKNKKTTNEGFLPSGEHIKKLEIAEQMKIEDLPNPLLAILPLITPIVMIIGFKQDVLIALSTACFVTVALLFKKFINMKKSFGDGIAFAGLPLIYVSGAVGLTTIIKAAPGFVLVVQTLQGMPGIFGGIILVMLSTGIVASSSSSLPTFLPDISTQMLGAGLTPEVAARMTVASGMTYMTPHNPGVINAIALTKLDFKQAAWIYFKSTTIPGLASVIVGVVLILTGIF